MNCKMKKINNVLIVIFVLGASIVAPFNLFSETPVKAASISSKMATDAVLALFANNNPSTNVLKLTTDQQAIDSAQQLVDVAVDITETVRGNMQTAINQAKNLLKIRNTPADYSLFADDADITSVAITGIIGKGITSVQLLIDGTVEATGTLNTDGTYSITTNDFITQGSKVEVAGYNGAAEVARTTVRVSNNEKPLTPGANEALAKTMAARAVSALFQDDRSSTNTLKPTTAQKTIDFAQNMIDVVLDPVVKANMQKDLDKAQSLLDTKNATSMAEKANQDVAKKAVDELFNNTSSSNTIKTTTDLAAIDVAKALVNKVIDPTVKAALQADVDKAQSLLDAKNATVLAEKTNQDAAKQAVDALFADATKTGIKPATDQATIDTAKALVNKVIDLTVKATLQADLDKAQQLLNNRNMVLAIPQLNPMTEAETIFSGKLDVSKYNPGTIRIYINNAPATVVAVDTNGNFSYTIGNLKAGYTIGVDYRDRTGQYSAATKTSITVTPASSNVTINKMTENDDTITGKTVPNAKVRYIVAGQPVNVGYADANGNYTMYVSKQKVGTVVGVEVFDLVTNKYKAAVTTTVTGAPKSTAYTINALTTEGDTLTGTAPANAKLRFSIDGNLISVITADASGNYSKYIGKQKVNTKISVELLNENTNQYTAPTEVTVSVGTGNATLAPVINTITEGQGVVTGKVPTSISQVRVWVNGVAQTMVSATNGNLTWTKANLKAGDTVKVDYKDATGTWISTEKIVTK
ncbi:toxin Cry1Ac domain D-VI-related protein [Listeria newyorkensis]|uniref:Pesticidal crystal protein Cry1Aa domain-containing protein n=1 Tax=Listeria newyorkensis TaxID=1497681 RepID=A0A841YW30_9LIST|nr:toxin Cry1Ac domain D-VI-related protein [Listeria newyorkensis]MBC1457600.1 hypothetical protein [Listeria newyorkensis]